MVQHKAWDRVCLHGNAASHALRTIKLGRVAHTSHFPGWRQEDILGYMVHLRSAWATWDPVFEQTTIPFLQFFLWVIPEINSRAFYTLRNYSTVELYFHPYEFPWTRSLQLSFADRRTLPTQSSPLILMLTSFPPLHIVEGPRGYLCRWISWL